MVLLDTNILSTFAKVGKLDVLFQLFVKDEIYITENVFFELHKAYEKELDFVEPIIRIIREGRLKIINTSQEELIFALDLPPFLGDGERDSIAICKVRDQVFLTDDLRAYRYARSEGLKVVTLSTLLRTLWKREIFSKDEIKILCQQIMERDHKLLDIEKILSD